MSTDHRNTIKNPHKLLDGSDHMEGMERVVMEVTDISRPFPTVTRVTGQINPSNPQKWMRPNVAVRLELEKDKDQRPLSRVYTVRNFDSERNQLEIDFVMHVDDSPAMRWLKQAKIGTKLTMIGPREHFVPSYDKNVKVAAFADETAIPAIRSILQHWPDAVEGILYIECRDEAAVLELPDITGVEKVVHLVRPDEKVGTTGWLVRSAQALPATQRWSVWAACERAEAREIKKHFIDNHGLTKADIKVFGYWRSGTSSSQIDHARLHHYAELRAKGGALKDFDDFDLPI